MAKMRDPRQSLEDQLDELEELDLVDLVDAKSLSLEERHLKAIGRLMGAVATRLGAACKDEEASPEVDQLVYDWVCLASAMDHIRTEIGGPALN